MAQENNKRPKLSGTTLQDGIYRDYDHNSDSILEASGVDVQVLSEELNTYLNEAKVSRVTEVAEVVELSGFDRRQMSVLIGAYAIKHEALLNHPLIGLIIRTEGL